MIEMEDLKRGVKKYATPLYVYDLDAVEETLTAFRLKFWDTADLCFAMKANPFLTGKMEKYVDRIEVCSMGEYRICRVLGIAPEKLLISGVLKQKEDILEILEECGGTCAYTVESLNQFYCLANWCEERCEVVHVYMRLTSGNQFGMDEETLAQVIKEKNIQKLFFEAHWIYRHKLDEMRKRMPVPIVFKIGVETFDHDFREKVLNKHADFSGPEEVARYFDSPCLMVGIKGQTKEMIARDIEYLKRYFKLGTVNVYNNNTTPIRRDEELVRWFMKEYQWLLDDPAVEVLYEITDFGVG